jgi:phosphatidylglycerophosphatase A
MKTLVLALATGFGLGRSPVASGTVGALLGVPIALALGVLAPSWQIAAAAVLALAAIPICSAAEAQLGRKDDGRIVADEYLTLPICFLGLPWAAHPWLIGLAFVTHRVMDIIKPPPARQAQNLQGGLGIVLDDVCAALYALAVNHAVVWVLGRFF